VIHQAGKIEAIQSESMKNRAFRRGKHSEGVKSQSEEMRTAGDKEVTTCMGY